jgi:hypothetical protein
MTIRIVKGIDLIDGLARLINKLLRLTPRKFLLGRGAIICEMTLALQTHHKIADFAEGFTLVERAFCECRLEWSVIQHPTPQLNAQSRRL